MVSRRLVLGSGIGLASAITATTGRAASLQSMEVISLFDNLPGDVSFKIVAPATGSEPRLYIAKNASQRLFVGSAIKTFALCQALVDVDSPDLLTTLRQQMLPLNDSVWSADSQVFNPPYLTGMVSERTSLEAMIMHSDNTATDMIFKYVGPDRIRGLISSLGLKSTSVPDSTRSFFGYILGAPDYKTFSWAELQSNPGIFVNPPLNPVETLASSCDDFISYYSRALQGRLFKNNETLTEFRRILNLGDVISIIGFPLGTTVFAKGGSIDVPGFHCLCVPGGMVFDNRWVYFCFTLNWYAEALTDPDTVAAFLAAVNKAVTLVHQRLS